MQSQISLTAGSHWPDELLQYLRQITREFQFNWNSIALQMQLYIENNQKYSGIQISSAICRQRFAFDYNTTNTNEVIKDDSVEKSSEISSIYSKAASIESIKNYESMSLEDLIAHVDSTEIKMKQQKEDIFKRVMTSLSISQQEKDDNKLLPMVLSDSDAVRQAYEESMLTKDAEKQKRLDQISALNEKQRIDNEREVLRKRFDFDSVDNEGIDPLANINSSSTAIEIEQVCGSDFMLKDDHKDLITSYDHNNTRAKNEGGLAPSLGNSLSLPYFESDEFEAILSELERDIHTKAVSKDEEEEPSELSEILSVLEAAAASRKVFANNISIAPINILSNTTNQVYYSTDDNNDSTDSISKHIPKASKQPGLNSTVESKSYTSTTTSYTEHNLKSRSEYDNCSTSRAITNPSITSSANSPPKHIIVSESSYTATATAVVSAREPNPSEGVSYNRSTMRSSKQHQKVSNGITTSNTAATESNDESTGNNQDGNHDDDDDDDDSEDDWKMMRNKQKKQHGVVEDSRNPRENATFWGAFGTTSTTTATTRHSAARNTQDASNAVLEISIASRIATEALAQNRIIHVDDDEVEESISSSVVVVNLDGSDRDIILPSPQHQVVAGNKTYEVYELVIENEDVSNLTLRNGTYFPPSPPTSSSFSKLSDLISTPDNAINVKEVVVDIGYPVSIHAPLILQEVSGSLANPGTNRRSKTSKLSSIMNSNNKPALKKSDKIKVAVSSNENKISGNLIENIDQPLLVSEPLYPIITAIESMPHPDHILSNNKPEQPIQNIILSEDNHLKVDNISISRLVDISAPTLSIFPFKKVTNKISGEMISCNGSTLPTACDESAQSMDHLVIADILTTIASSDEVDDELLNGSDIPWIQLLSWLIGISKENYIIVAMQWMNAHNQSSIPTSSSSETKEVLRLVLETKPSVSISSNDMMEKIKSTSINEVITLPYLITNTKKVSDFISIKDVMANSFVADLQSFVNIPSMQMTSRSSIINCNVQANLPVTYNNANNVAVCILKDYTIDLISGEFLIALVTRAEESGLRLCGLRIVYLDTIKLYEYEKFCSIPVHTRAASIISKSATCGGTQHLLMPLCLAFHTNSSSSTTSSILRSIFGPEDPELALKTDPGSLRALYGTSKDLNLVYPIAHSPPRISKEVSFWFGGRKSDTSVEERPIISNQQVTSTNMLFAGQFRAFKVGICFSSIRENLNSLSGIVHHTLQKAMLNSMDSSLGSSCMLLSLTSTSSLSTYKKLMCNNHVIRSLHLPGHMNTTTATTTNATVNECDQRSSQYFIWDFVSYVSVLYVTKSLCAIHDQITRSIITISNLDCSVSVEWAPYLQSPQSTEALPPSSTSTSVSDSSNTDLGVSGSRLIALEMLKTIPEDNYKSHEDVGLADVVLIRLYTHSDDTVQLTTSDSSRDLFCKYLLALFKQLPVTCQTSIVAIKSTNNAKNMLIALRGYQIIENIDFAISLLRNTSSSLDAMNNKSTLKQHISNVGSNYKNVVNNKDSSTTSTTSNSSEIFSNLYTKVYRGRKSLEMLFIEFPLDALFIDLANRDLNIYVPPSTLIKSNTASLAYSYAQALYPPGIFSALAVLIIPWQHIDSNTMTRNLGRIITRLEKEDFELLEIKAVKDINISLLKDLYHENIAEYIVSSVVSTSNELDFSKFGTSSHIDSLNGDSLFDTSTTSNAVVILVRRRSALLRLKSIVGPIFSTDILESQYPRSLMCLLTSLYASSNLSNNIRNSKSINKLPFVFPTLTCISTQQALKYLFPTFYTSNELQQRSISINGTHHSNHQQLLPYPRVNQQSLQPIANHWIHKLNEINEGEQQTFLPHGDTIQLKSSIIASSSLSPSKTLATTIQSSLIDELHIPPSNNISPSSTNTNLTKNVDIAGIVICHALLKQDGLGTIIESLYREELVVRNIYSSYLPNRIVKHLLQLAGASSLSMKPSLEFLVHTSNPSSSPSVPPSGCSSSYDDYSSIDQLQGPAIILGVEGPSHAFVRFKSFINISSRNSTLLWKITPAIDTKQQSQVTNNTNINNVTTNTNNTTANTTYLKQSPSTISEWGVLASSSSRLAKDLYKFCFDEIYGESDSNFTIVLPTNK